MLCNLGDFLKGTGLFLLEILPMVPFGDSSRKRDFTQERLPIAIFEDGGGCYLTTDSFFLSACLKA